MVDTIELTDWEMRLCRTQAGKVASKWKAADKEDLEGELLLWACENYHHVVRYRTEQHGRSKLAKAMYRWATGKAMKAQEARNGRRLRDEWSPYSKEQVKAALPYVWDREGWPTGQAVEDPRHGGMVSPGSDKVQDALCVLIDVSTAVSQVPQRDQDYLRARYRDGLPTREAAELFGVAPSDMSRRIWDAVDRVHARLSASAYRAQQ